MVELYDALVHENKGQPALPKVVPPVEETFANAEMGTDADSLWEEAKMVEVVLYLRGGKGLSIPAEVRPVLPERLWGLKKTFISSKQVQSLIL